MNTRKAVLFFVLALLLAAPSVWAQTGTSSVTGVVTDQSGAVVVGAAVTLSNETTGIKYTTTTTEAGTYFFHAIPPSLYSIKVELSGFKTFVSRNNVLTVGTPLSVNASLQIGESTTIIEVTESFERVQTSTSGNFGAIVDNRTLTDLPLGLESGTGGRNPLIFVRLQPGVVTGANTGGSSHVNGARDRAFNYTLDGIDINESSAGGSEFSPLRTNPDSLQEFRVITSNASAEYGRNSGAQVELRTKSGGNEFHGNLFYFHRNSYLSANEWGNKRGPLLVNRGFLLQHQYGYTVGGPIFKNRTFFFTNYQGQRQVSPISRTRLVYTSLARMGMFRYVAGGQNRNFGQSGASVDVNGNALLPACAPPGLVTACINSVNIATRDPRVVGMVGVGGLDNTILNQWIALTPLPNVFTSGDGLNTAGFAYTTGRTDPQRDFSTKIDHRFNESNEMFGRLSWGRQDTVDDSVNGGERRFPGLMPISNALRKPINAALNYRRVISPRMVNEVVAGFNRFTFNFVVLGAGQTLPFILNTITDPLANDRGNLRTINTYQLVDNFSWQRGAHGLKMGINFRYQQHIDVRGSVAGLNSELQVTFGQTVTTTCTTALRFDNGGAPGVVAGQERFCLPSLNGTAGAALTINTTDRGLLQNTINNLLGRVGQVRQGFVAADDQQSFLPGGSTFRNDARYGEYDFYFQDSWRVRPNITVDLGVRLELKGHPTSPRNRIFQPDSPAIFGATPSDALRWVHGPLYNDDYNNWAPSIGAAWDPFKTGKTSIRGNYRISYDRINTFVISSQIYNTVPGLVTPVTNLTFGQTGGTGGTAGRFRDGLPSLTPPATPTPQTLSQPPSYGVGTIAVMDPNFRTPRTHLWQFDIQRQVWKGITVDVAYIGRKANNLFGAYDANAIDVTANNFLAEFAAVQAGGSSALIDSLYVADPRLAAGQTGSQFVQSQFVTTLLNNSVGSLVNDLSTPRLTASIAGANVLVPPFFCATRTGTTCTALSGRPLTFFRPFPQFGAVRVIDSDDISNYHALQVIVQRKFVRNLSFQGSYTWAKSLDTRSFDPAFTVVSTGNAQSASSTPFDLNNRRLNYARSDFDRKHSFIGYAIYDLPFGPGQRWLSDAPPLLRQLVEGWQLNGVLTMTSGRPFTVYSGFLQFGNLVNATADCTGCAHDMGVIREVDTAYPNAAAYFDAGERALFSQPALGSNGNTGRNFFTGNGNFNIDAAALKRIRFTERIRSEWRLELFNLTNSPVFGFPGTVIPANTTTGPGTGATTLGQVTGTTNEGRKVRLGLKISF